jgi:colanic acid/amylovoran biosynthesis protein
MKILVTGQCTLHWGRMEYGNIGNYYIVEPFFKELFRVFPDADIVTTLQMTEKFCMINKIRVIPMDLYYGWKENDLDMALKEFAIATIYCKTNTLIEKTPFIEEVISSDLVIDFSGDIWGDNADLVGEHRFLTGLLKDRVVQLLKIPVVMLAGSPGPFSNRHLLPLTKDVYEHFTLVTNREELSTRLLVNDGFNIRNTVNLACPSFLFEAAPDTEIQKFIKNTPLWNREKPIFGFILCGWNMTEGPFNKPVRSDSEYTQFIHVIEYIVNEMNGILCLMSHSNGFALPPHFKLTKGRDFPIIKQLYDLLDDTVKKNVILLDDIYSPAETKAIIKRFDMLISGRIHGAIAALSQSIPTVIIDYGHPPKAHKLRGFAELTQMQEYVADPTSDVDMTDKIRKCWNNRVAIIENLKARNVVIQDMARKNFDLLRNVVKTKLQIRQ